MIHPLFQRLDDDEPLRSLAGLGREAAAPLPAGAAGSPVPSDPIFGLSISPLFQAGVAGLAENNPLTTFQTGLASQARQQARAREEAELRQFGIALGKIARQSGDPAMQRLVALGPDGYRAAVARLNELAAAQRAVPGTESDGGTSTQLVERGVLPLPETAPPVPLRPAMGPLAEQGGIGLASEPFLSDPDIDLRPSINSAQAMRRQQQRLVPRAERLDDPVFGALNPMEVRQIAEEIAGVPVPHTKRSFAPLIEFARWGAAVDKAGVSGNACWAFMETFGIEGGLEEDSVNKAVAGIRKRTLDLVGKEAGIREGTKPRDLTHQQRIRVYQEFMKLPGYLNPVGGLAALDQLRDEEVAAALFDTLFRNGSGGGTGAIQKAINRVDPGRVVVDKSFGSRTFHAFRRLTDDCGTRQQLLDALADERETERREADPEGKVDEGDLDRFRYFRFLGSSACQGSEGAHSGAP